jgi:predicted AlkP superfamily pyrophosphatase or phosphodiesterase
MADQTRVLVVQVAALDWQLVQRFPAIGQGLDLSFVPLAPVFPAVTCAAQATFRTGLAPEQHGIVGNGLFNRSTRRVGFWEQSAHLLPPVRIWDEYRAADHSVGTICWQQSLGDSVDFILSPAPIHKHSGGMIQDCYTQPAGIYPQLCRAIGRKFSLFSYWGPLASAKSTAWITDATIEVMTRPEWASDLLLTYLPHLDYVLQKQGPEDEKAVVNAVNILAAELAKLRAATDRAGYRLLVWGDYAITPATSVVYPNRLLCDAGFFRTREVKGRQYPDLYCSQAFAMVDHQIAHVFVSQAAAIDAVRSCLAGTPGIAEVVLREDSLNHPNSGELILTAAPGAWFAYPWWSQAGQAPDYASHVDIHNKIGFDPCELFWGRWFPPAISQNPGRVMGTHGRIDRPAAFATDLDLAEQPDSLVELAIACRHALQN